VNPDDLPKSIRAIFKEFIREKAQIAPGFLSTFEFNRLEFDARCRLNNMNKQRRALMIGFLVFYRTLIFEIFKNYLTYFPKIREMGNPIGDVLNKNIKRSNQPKVNGMSRKNMNNIHPDIQKEINELNKKSNNPNDKDINIINKFKGPDADTQILYYKKRKMEIRNNLVFNFNFIMQVLDNILRRAFKANPPVYNDYFKNKHLYNLMVFSPEMDRKRQLVTSSDNDDQIEFMNAVYTPSQDCEVFLRDNQRWMHMYELSTIELCGDLANKIMDDEVPKVIKGINLNTNQYSVNRPQNQNNINENNKEDKNNILPNINTGNKNQIENTEENNKNKNTTEDNKEEDKKEEDEENEDEE
jgi:hypothetical protein